MGRAFLSPNVKMGTIKVIKMDLHGYHPSEIVQTDVLKKSFSKHGKWVRTM